MTARSSDHLASPEATPSPDVAIGAASTAVSWFVRLEAALERWGEWLNPILVKEARQALKSKQFTITFSLLLICGWVWSMIGVVTMMPDIYYAPSGLSLLAGYYMILAVPLLLIVPFTAFRSLAAEREDGTYELLSISTLTSRQIVTGKLGSAFLQMLVYYSALAPCIAFTYMLRGLDLISIALLLFYTFCMAVLLSCVGLVFAGLSRARHWQSLLSVGLLLILVFVGFLWAMSVAEILDELGNLPLDEVEFWVAQGAVITAFLTYVVILVLVAAAQNSFPSDNRSTRIRIAISVQTVLFIGWTSLGWLYFADAEFLLVALMFAAFHWVVYGALLSGESAVLSPRVRRQLPQSFLGRVFLTWYNPGSGTGYLFAVSHLAILCLLVIVAIVIQQDVNYPAPRFSRPNDERIIQFAGLLLGYYIAYLGTSRLCFLAIPNRQRYGLLLPVLIHFLVALAGSALPFVYESWRRRYGIFEYSLLQASNWAWTLEECIDQGIGIPLVWLIVLSAAIGVLFVNLMVVRTEVEAVRMATPERVSAEERAARSTTSEPAVHPLEDAGAGEV